MTLATRKQIKQAMLDKDLNGPRLAKLTGYAHGTIKNILCGCNTCDRQRRRIEDALGVAIWTDPLEFQARQSGLEQRPAETRQTNTKDN